MHTSSSLAVSFISRIILSWRRRSFSRFSLSTPFRRRNTSSSCSSRRCFTSSSICSIFSLCLFRQFLAISRFLSSRCFFLSSRVSATRHRLQMKETLVRLRQRRRLRRLHTSAVHQFVRIALDGQSLLQRKGGGTTHARTCDDSRESGVGEDTEVGDTTSAVDGRSLFSVNRSLFISSHEKTSAGQRSEKPPTIIDRRHHLSVLRVSRHKIEQVIDLRHLSEQKTASGRYKETPS